MNNMENMKVEIQVVNIKNMSGKIPDFIDRVPLLLIQNERKIIHDEELFDFIKSNEKTIEPFMINEMIGLSDRYSFMEDKQLDHGYVFLDRGDQLITNNENVSDETSKIINYDLYMEERDKDIKNIFKNQNPAIQPNT
tara:strand:- start:2311 stop:2724 length:414 start_codon:yes stop_codon:yes gene_type:complete